MPTVASSLCWAWQAVPELPGLRPPLRHLSKPYALVCEPRGAPLFLTLLDNASATPSLFDRVATKARLCVTASVRARTSPGSHTPFHLACLPRRVRAREGRIARGSTWQTASPPGLWPHGRGKWGMTSTPRCPAAGMVGESRTGRPAQARQGPGAQKGDRRAQRYPLAHPPPPTFGAGGQGCSLLGRKFTGPH